MSLCDTCKNKDVSIEFRNSEVVNYEIEVCLFEHQWFKKVREEKHCRDYTPEIDNSAAEVVND